MPPDDDFTLGVEEEYLLVDPASRELVPACHAEALRGEEAPDPRPELLWAARWRAARYGVGGELVDVTTRQLVPARLLVERLLTYLRPDLEQHKEWAEVSDLVDATMARGPGADRQRAAYQRAGRFEEVVDQVVAETAAA